MGERTGRRRVRFEEEPMPRRIRTAALAVAATLLVVTTLAAHTKAVKTLPAAE